MAKSKLSEDELAWILTLDATEAQQELRKVNRESKELSKTNKELVNKMNDLIAAGKKESEEYRNLSKEVKANNAALALNRERVQALEGQIGTTALTMNQLHKQAKELQRQLDNTSKATNPDEYKRLETRLNGVREQMSELRNNGKETGNALSSSFMKVSTAVKGFAALKVVQWLKDLTVSAFNTRSEFARYETVLTQTLQSQEAAADAMRMLKDLANDTPYALSELTDAYVKMVNRGITPSREELIKLGDLSSSLGKSLDQLIEALLDAQTGEFERLKEFGIKASKENDKVTFSFKGVQTQVQFNEQAIADYIYSLGELQGVQGGMVAQMDQLGGKLSNLSDAWDNLLNNLGKKLEPFFKWVLDSSTSVVNAIGGLFTSSSETYRQQFDKVAELDRTLPNLIATYESLANKTNRSAEENKRLKETVDALAKAVPSSVNGWHKLTGAMDINISKVHEYLEAEKARLQFMNQERIKEVEKQVKKYENKLDEIREKLNKKGEYQIVGKSSLTLFAEYSNDVLGQLQKDEEKYEQLLTGANEELKRLNGTSLQDQLNTQNEKLQKQQEFNQMTKQQLAEYIQTNKNAADQYVELAQSIYNTRFSSQNNSLTNEKNQYKEQLDALDQYILEKKTKLLNAFSTNQITEMEYNDQLQQLELENLMKRLEIFNLEKEKQQEILQKLYEYREKLVKEYVEFEKEQLDLLKENREQQSNDNAKRSLSEINAEMQARSAGIKKMQALETQAQLAKQEKIVAYLADFSDNIGTLVGGAISGNEDIVKSSLVSIINMALDALKLQTEMALAGATIQSLAKSVMNPAAFARAALIITGIEAAFAAVKSIVNSSINNIGKGSNDSLSTSNSSSNTGNRVVTGLEEGGSMPVTRAQDGKNFNAVFQPGKRGYVNRPTVIVGDGPVGRSREWVASNDALRNPTVAPFINVLNEAQSKGIIRTVDMNQLMRRRLAGFQSGGFLGSPATVVQSAASTKAMPVATTTDAGTLERLCALLSRIETKGVRSYVVYNDIEKTKQTLDNAKKIGAK